MADNGVRVTVRLEWPEAGSKPFAIGRWESEGSPPYLRTWSLDNVAALQRDDLALVVKSVIESLEALLAS